MEAILPESKAFQVYAFGNAIQLHDHYSAKNKNITVYPMGYNLIDSNWPVDPTIPHPTMVFRSRLPNSTQTGNIIIQVSTDMPESIRQYLLDHDIVLGGLRYFEDTFSLVDSVDHHHFTDIAKHVQYPLSRNFVTWGKSIVSRSADAFFAPSVTYDGSTTTRSVDRSQFIWKATGLWIDAGTKMPANMNGHCMIGSNLDEFHKRPWRRHPHASERLEAGDITRTGGVAYVTDYDTELVGKPIHTIKYGFDNDSIVPITEINSNQIRFTFDRNDDVNHTALLNTWSLIMWAIWGIVDVQNQTMWFTQDVQNKVTANVVSFKNVLDLITPEWNTIHDICAAYMKNKSELAIIHVANLVWKTAIGPLEIIMDRRSMPVVDVMNKYTSDSEQMFAQLSKCKTDNEVDLINREIIGA